MNIGQYLSSSLGKKQLVSLTGLGLIVGFLIPHLIGNLYLLKGPEQFNAYSAQLHSLGIILKIVELLFLLLFVVHIGLTILLVIQNRMARGTSYHRSIASETRSFAARTMPYTGALILIFLFIHLRDYAFTKHVPTELGLYGLVVDSFKNPLRLYGYGFVMLVVGLHLSHAIQSVFQTFGLKRERYVALVNIVSYTAGILLSLGFISILVVVCLKN